MGKRITEELYHVDNCGNISPMSSYCSRYAPSNSFEVPTLGRYVTYFHNEYVETYGPQLESATVWKNGKVIGRILPFEYNQKKVDLKAAMAEYAEKEKEYLLWKPVIEAWRRITT
jgi:hypothetical protein